MIKQKNQTKKPTMTIGYEDDNSLKFRDFYRTISILDNMTDAIFVINREGKIEHANATALEVLNLNIANVKNLSIDEILMDSLYDNRHPSIDEFSHESNSELISNLQNGIFTDLEASLIHDSSVTPVILDFNILRDDENRLEYIIVTAKDISTTKKLENELKQQQTLAISQDRLRALGELSVCIIHELSQPLSALKLQLEMTKSQAEKGLENSALIEQYQRMHDHIERMSNIIQNMRSFAHQTEDNTITVVNINRAIKTASSLVSFGLKKQNIFVLFDIDPELPFIISNRLLIEQVIVNLLSNAKDAFVSMETNQPMFHKKEIHIVSRVFDNSYIEITVEDNAGAIDTNIKDRIFDPFFSTKASDDNSGLGLSISKNIINSMGGVIESVDTGANTTKFSVKIPIGLQDSFKPFIPNINEHN